MLFRSNTRHESRGAHAHENYPDRDDVNWLAHSVAHVNTDNGNVTMSTRPVIMGVGDADVEPIALKARTY